MHNKTSIRVGLTLAAAAILVVSWLSVVSTEQQAHASACNVHQPSGRYSGNSCIGGNPNTGTLNVHYHVPHP
jgi:hypothetical protein